MPVIGPFLFNRKHLLPALEERFRQAAEHFFEYRDAPRTTNAKIARVIAGEAKVDPLVLGKADSWVRGDDEIPGGGRRPKHEIKHMLASAFFEYEGDAELWHWLPTGFKPRQVQAELGLGIMTITARVPSGREDELEEEVRTAFEAIRGILVAQRLEVERFNAELLETARLRVRERQQAIAKHNAIEARLAKLSFN